MRIFAHKPKVFQQTNSAKFAKARPAFSGQSRDLHSILHLQRTAGNHTLQRLLRSKTEDLEARSASNTSPGIAHDFSRIPVHASGHSNIQPKLKVNAPGDKYELEADRVAAQVMRMPEQHLQHACACGGGCPKCRTEQTDQENYRLQTKRARLRSGVQSGRIPVGTNERTSPGQLLSRPSGRVERGSPTDPVPVAEAPGYRLLLVETGGTAILRSFPLSLSYADLNRVNSMRELYLSTPSNFLIALPSL